MEYTNTIPVIEVNQKIGTFYLSKLTPKILHMIANKKLSRYDTPTFGIQRKLNSEKVNQIQKYIAEDKTATFPNTIIVAIQNDPEEEFGNYVLDKNGIKILLKEGIANILDGQHRLNGLDESDETFEFPVAFFLDLSIGEQAKIFAKINSTQTKVSLDLVYELFDLSTQRHPEKSAYYIVKHLNEDQGSPWRGLIKNLTDRSGLLAQGSMAKFIDKELLSSGKVLNELYVKKQEEIAYKMLRNYFEALEEVFVVSWGNKNSILNKSTGFVGAMRFFVDLAKLCKINNIEMNKNYILQHVAKCKEEDRNFTSKEYRSGAVGQNEIRNILRRSLSVNEKEDLGIK